MFQQALGQCETHRLNVPGYLEHWRSSRSSGSHLALSEDERKKLNVRETSGTMKRVDV
jgi:hypothetical protein